MSVADLSGGTLLVHRSGPAGHALQAFAATDLAQPFLSLPGVSSALLSADGRRVLTSVAAEGGARVDVRVVALDRATVGSGSTSLDGMPRGFRASADGGRVLLHGDREVVVLDAQGERLRVLLTGVIVCCVGRSADISPDGTRVVVSDRLGAGLVTVYEETNGAFMPRWTTVAGKENIDYVQSADDRSFAVASRARVSSPGVGDVVVPLGAQVALYDVASPAPRWTTPLDTFDFWAFDVGPDGTVAFGGRGPGPRVVVGVLRGDGTWGAVRGEASGWGRVYDVEIASASSRVLVSGATNTFAIFSDDLKWAVLQG